MNFTKKLGDIYENWEDLEYFPECYKWCELVEKFPHINKDALFVCNGGYFRRGEIIKLEKDDGSINPYFTNGRIVKCPTTTRLALLPTETEAAEKPVPVEVPLKEPEETNKQRFKHKMLQLEDSLQIERALEKLEKEGWELVSTSVYASSEFGYGVYLFFKRPL